MHVNEELKPLFNSIIISAVFSFVISHCQFHDQNSVKPIIFFAQVANIVTQELLEDGTQFRKDVNSKVVEFCGKLDMKFVPNLIKFQVFLNSQHEQNLVNNDFLQEL